jgi:hypothetical protein
MENKLLTPGLPSMTALALIIGGFTGHVLLFVVILFFVVAGTVELLRRILELRNGWKRRER